MRNRALGLSFSVAIGFAAMSCHAPVPHEHLRDYEIYNRLFQDKTWAVTGGGNAEASTLVVFNKTTMDPAFQEQDIVQDQSSLWGWLSVHVSDLRRSTFESFVRKNQAAIKLNRSHFSDTRVTLVNNSSGHFPLYELEGVPSWSVFYDRYPDSAGIIVFSRVGFSSDGGQALLYYGRQWAELGGAGRMVVLQREDSDWRVIDAIKIWDS